MEIIFNKVEEGFVSVGLYVGEVDGLVKLEQEKLAE